MDTQSPPTSSMSSEDLAALGALADGTGTQVREQAPRTRRTAWIVLAAAVVIVGVGITAWAFSRGDTHTSVAAADPPPPPEKDTSSAIRVTQLPDEPPPKPVDDVKPPAPPQVAPDKVERPDRPVVKRPPRVKKDPVVKQPPDPPPKPEVTAAMVENQYRKAQRLYAAFKEKNGGRLESDYANLMTSLQWAKDPADKLKKIDSFIAKMRE
jgi:outer membrane biosynthesis protein TonB